MRSFLVPLGKFSAEYSLRILGLSLILLLPCFWQRYLEAGDLGSHLYNAWLVQLIHEGKAPGLWIANQWNNVLFDWLIYGCVQVFGFGFADKIAVAFLVLLFFWGAFTLATVLSGRPPWFMVPALAMVAYGWTFNMGFFNFYFSVAISFWALAILTTADGWQQAAALPLLALTYMAHPLGFAWAAGASFYVFAARRIRPGKQWFLLALAGLFLIGVHYFIWSHYQIRRPLYLLYYINGADQIVLTKLYYIPAGASLVLGSVAVFNECFRRWRESLPSVLFSIPAQLYIVLLIGVWTLPTEIFLPQYVRSLSYILERLSLVSAIMACCIMGMVHSRAMYGICLVAIAAVYFAFMYRDTALLNRREMKFNTMVASIGPGQRVVGSYVSAGPISRVKYNHMLDRQCIGRCYSLENYEPLTLQFRVRASPDSPIIATPREDPAITDSRAHFQIASKYFPVYEFYMRSSDVDDIGVRIWRNPEKAD